MLSLRGLERTTRERAERAFREARHIGLSPIVTSVNRTCEEQARLYKRFLEGRSDWPAARPGESAHQYGLAFDSWIDGDERMDAWTSIRRLSGLEVLSHDIIHAQWPNWRECVFGR